MHIVRRVGKIVGYTIVGLLLLSLLAILAIQFPAVQTWATAKVTEAFTDQLKTEVRVGGVDIDFFKTAVLEDIFIADQRGDTLLAAQRLGVDIGIFDLFESEIFLNKIKLEKATVRLLRSETDSVFNYQFIADAFASDAPPDTTATPWTFGALKLELNDVRFEILDEGPGRFQLLTNLPSFTVTADELDFAEQKIALERLELNLAAVTFRQLLADSTQILPQAANEIPLEFPGIGWTISVEKVRFEDNRLALFDDNSLRLENALDYSNLDLGNLNLSINDFRYADDGILGEIENLSARDASGFQLDKLAAEVQVLPDRIQLNSLLLRTPLSEVKNDTRLIFNEFNDLTAFLDKVKLASDFGESRLAVSDLLMLAPALRGIENLKFPEGEILRLDGQLALENEKLILAGLTFAASRPGFTSGGENIRLEASGSIAQLTTDPRYDLRLQRLSVSYPALRNHLRNVELPVGLEAFGRTELSGNFAGTLADLTATGIRLTTQSATRFSGDLHVTGLPDVDRTIFDLKIKDLATRSADLQGFAETPLPPQLDSLGLVQFSGSFQGTIRDFDLAGLFQTGAGNAGTDLKLKFNDDYSFASYRGRLAANGLHLGRVLADTSLGRLWLDAELDGEGLALNELNTTMLGQVRKAEYRGYEYQNLKVDGRFVQQQFEGEMAMQDENLSFALAGKVNLNDSLPDFDATVRIDTINLRNLNLSEQELGLSGQVAAQLRGMQLDDLQGVATLTDFAISGDAQNYFDRKIVLEARQFGNGKRALLFDADFLQARVEGQYQFGELPGLVVSYVNDFFPVEGLVELPDSLGSPQPEMADQHFDFDFRFTDLASLAGVFFPGLSAIDTTAYLRGKFNSEEKQLDVSGAFPNIEFEGNTLDSLLFSVSGNRRRLRSSVAMRNLRAGTLNAPFFDFGTRLADDTMRLDVAVLDDSLGTNFKWGGMSVELLDDYLLVFDPSLVLDGEMWKVSPANAIYFSRKSLKISDLEFRKNKQLITVNSVGEAPPNDLASLQLRFANFRLSEVSALLNNPDLHLEGALDGQFNLLEPLQHLHFTADLQAQGIVLNEQSVGNLELDAAQSSPQNPVELMANLSGANQANLTGRYAVDSEQLDLQAKFGKLNLVLLDPFLNSLIRDSEGHVAGGFSVGGKMDSLKLEGELTTHRVSTEVLLSGTRYSTDGNTVRFSEKEIDIGQQVIADAQGRKATLSGRVLHDFFDNIRLDLRAQTDGLQILNTTRKESELYYGKLFASADVKITGTAELPRLDVLATTLDSSLLHVEPLIADLAVVQEDYVIFANPNEYEPDSLTILEKRVGAAQGGFDLSLVLEVTPDAVLNVIIDPRTGDELFCSGRGNFIVKMNPAGDLSVTGTYVIEEGKYTFSYEGLVNREFEIRKGSSLSFAGDPYDARFDIVAVYKTRATTYELINNESTLDEVTLAASKRRTDTEVLMNIGGNLTEPEITFDVELPNSQGGLVDNLTARKLADLRDDPTELNKQVFGLLFFNSFIQSETGADLAGVGESVALSSVSDLITNQLNRLADRFVKGVDLTLGFESYRSAGQDAGTVTELQVGLSKQLFNDRLTVRIGGNFNLENSQQSTLEEGGYSAIAGDFVLEYKLSEQGNYLLSVFHKSDYNSIIDANSTKTGVGVIYRKSY